MKLSPNKNQINSMSDEIASPCTGVCKIDPKNEWCQGCKRTIQEISVWSAASNQLKLDIWARILYRNKN